MNTNPTELNELDEIEAAEAAQDVTLSRIPMSVTALVTCLVGAVSLIAALTVLTSADAYAVFNGVSSAPGLWVLFLLVFSSILAVVSVVFAVANIFRRLKSVFAWVALVVIVLIRSRVRRL